MTIDEKHAPSHQSTRGQYLDCRSNLDVVHCLSIISVTVIYHAFSASQRRSDAPFNCDPLPNTPEHYRTWSCLHLVCRTTYNRKLTILRPSLRRNLRASVTPFQRERILFYNKHEPYYEFTNSSLHDVVYAEPLGAGDFELVGVKLGDYGYFF